MIFHQIKPVLNIFLLSAAIFIAGGCSAVIYELKSVEENPDYLRGREVVYRENGKCISSVSFEYQQDQNFIFYVEFKNTGDDPFTVYPESIYADQLNGKKKFLSDKSKSRFYALDPEENIHRISLQSGYNESNHAINSGITATFSLINIVSHLSDNENTHKLESLSYDLGIWSAVQTNEDIRYENAKNELDSGLAFWRDEVLRKTTLYKNESAGGYILVPFNRDAKFIRLVLPVGSSDHIYEYKMIEI